MFEYISEQGWVNVYMLFQVIDIYSAPGMSHINQHSSAVPT